MILKGRTRKEILEEQTKIQNKELLDNAQKEVEEELSGIVRNMAIEKYIEKQKIL